MARSELKSIAPFCTLPVRKRERRTSGRGATQLGLAPADASCLSHIPQRAQSTTWLLIRMQRMSASVNREARVITASRQQAKQAQRWLA